jgi:hypothetical protein
LDFFFKVFLTITQRRIGTPYRHFSRSYCPLSFRVEITEKLYPNRSLQCIPSVSDMLLCEQDINLDFRDSMTCFIRVLVTIDILYSKKLEWTKLLLYLNYFFTGWFKDTVSTEKISWLQKEIEWNTQILTVIRLLEESVVTYIGLLSQNLLAGGGLKKPTRSLNNYSGPLADVWTWNTQISEQLWQPLYSGTFSWNVFRIKFLFIVLA